MDQLQFPPPNDILDEQISQQQHLLSSLLEQRASLQQLIDREGARLQSLQAQKIERQIAPLIDQFSSQLSLQTIPQSISNSAYVDGDESPNQALQQLPNDDPPSHGDLSIEEELEREKLIDRKDLEEYLYSQPHSQVKVKRCVLQSEKNEIDRILVNIRNGKNKPRDGTAATAPSLRYRDLKRESDELSRRLQFYRAVAKGFPMTDGLRCPTRKELNRERKVRKIHYLFIA